jgi:hypothetical protein
VSENQFALLKVWILVSNRLQFKKY